MLRESVNQTGDHVIVERTPISNQGRLSSCVANAVADALEIQLGVQDPTSVVQLSRLHLYYNARSYTHTTDRDEGTEISSAIDSLRTLGVCLEATWPYVEANVFAQPPLRAYKEGLDNKVLEAYRVAGGPQERCDGVEAAVRANHAIVFATAVDNAYEGYNGGNKVWMPPSSWAGYHAQIITGVRRNANGGREFLVRNSWGANWGQNGHIWIDESYVGWTETSDLWVVTTVPSLVF